MAGSVGAGVRGSGTLPGVERAGVLTGALANAGVLGRKRSYSGTTVVCTCPACGLACAMQAACENGQFVKKRTILDDGRWFWVAVVVLKDGRRRLELTERDMEFLRVLAGVGVLSLEHVRKFYGDAQQYHLNRVKKLVKWGLVKRRQGCVWPTSRLLDLLECGEQVVLVPRRRRGASFGIADLYLALRCVPGVEVKLRRELGGVERKHLVAVLRAGGREYGVFLLEGKSQFAIGRVFDGLKETGASHAVVLCLSREGMEEFSRLAEVFCRGLGLEELLLLPADRGPTVLAGVLSPGFEGLLEGAFPGIERVASWSWRWNGREVVVLVANDLVSRWRLLEGGCAGKLLVCLSGQRRFFSVLFPGAEFAILKDDFSGWAELPSNLGVVERSSSPPCREVVMGG